MRFFPLEVIASWPEPNYEHPQIRDSALFVVNAIFITLTIMAVAARVYARIWISQWFGIDDAFILLALLTAIGMTICVLLANISYGWNRHVWDIKFQLIIPAFQIAFATKIIFSLAAMFTRLSLTLFYYRLVKDSGMHKFRLAIHAALVFGIIVGFASVLFTIFQCSPIRAFWTYPPIEGAKCLDEGKLTLGCGIVITFADFLTAVLPIPMIARLKMPMRRRIGVCILLGLGFVVVVAGAVRSYFIWFSLIKSYDETWYCYPLWISAAVEIDLAVICACAPSFRLLLHAFRAKYSKKSERSFSSLGSSEGCSRGQSALSGASAKTLTAARLSVPPSPTVFQHPRKINEVTSMPVRERTWEHMQRQQQAQARIETLIERASSPEDDEEIGARASLGVSACGDGGEAAGDIVVRTKVDMFSSPTASQQGSETALDRYVTQQAERTLAMQSVVRQMTSKPGSRRESRDRDIERQGPL